MYNNGKGIPVVMHKDENMYVPTLIFGHLLTSSNYNDDEEKVTGGRNGYGAKLCNIFSTKFVLETTSKEYKKSFKQTWRNNMGKTAEPNIQSYSKDDYTRVTFSPDLPKFKVTFSFYCHMINLVKDYLIIYHYRWTVWIVIQWLFFQSELLMLQLQLVE